MKINFKYVLFSVSFFAFLVVGVFVFNFIFKKDVSNTQTASVLGSFWSDLKGLIFKEPNTKSNLSASPDNMCLSANYNYLGQWGTLGLGDGQFSGPADIATDASGNVYVADYKNNRIQKFNSTGVYVSQWGTNGSGNGQFKGPSGVTVDSQGFVYVVDRNNFRVQKFTPDGGYVLQWGGQGGEGGKFVRPWGIARDSLNNIYVVDNGSNSVQKFTSNGAFILKWGVSGAGNGEFSKPYGVDVGLGDVVYVTDTANNRIQKFNSAGVYLSQWGILGIGDGQMKLPFGVDVDANGDVFVADTSNNRIQKFTSDGVFITKFGLQGIGNGQLQFPQGLEVGLNDVVYVADTNNNRVEEFAKECGRIVIKKQVEPFPDSTDFNFFRNFGPLFVLDDDNDPVLENIKIFNLNISDGDFTVTEMNTPGYNTTVSCVDPSGGTTTICSTANISITQGETVTCTFTNKCNGDHFIFKWGSYGQNGGQFNFGRGIASDSFGNVYVTDNNRVQKFDSAGVFQMAWGWGVQDGSNQFQTCVSGCMLGLSGSGDGQFSSPEGVAVDSMGNVYVADFNNNRIEVFTSNGIFLSKFGSFGVGDGQFRFPYSIAIDSNDNLYIDDFANYRINKFNSSGVFQMAWGWGVQDGSNQAQICTVGCKKGIPSSNDGGLYSARDIAVDSNDNIYVLDSGAANGQIPRIQKFSSSGGFIKKWLNFGSCNGQFKYLSGLVVNSSGQIYVGEWSPSGSRILKGDQDGNYLSSFGSLGSGDGQFGVTVGLTLDPSDGLYVLDRDNNRVQKFGPGCN